jgi:hypothetical protein
VVASEVAIASAKRPPRVWLQAGSATIYAHRFDAPNDEATVIIGGDEPQHRRGEVVGSRVVNSAKGLPDQPTR